MDTVDITISTGITCNVVVWKRNLPVLLLLNWSAVVTMAMVTDTVVMDITTISMVMVDMVIICNVVVIAPRLAVVGVIMAVGAIPASITEVGVITDSTEAGATMAVGYNAVVWKQLKSQS